MSVSDPRPDRAEKALAEVWACEMVYDGPLPEAPELNCAPLSEAIFEAYREMYNACFYPMRRALDIRPHCWYGEDARLEDVPPGVFVLMEDGELVGSVACRGGEVDDLIVSPSRRGRGYGEALLRWAMRRVRGEGHREIVLRVAEWNAAALRLYLRMGFAVTRRERVR